MAENDRQNVDPLVAFDAQSVCSDIRDLRDRVVAAWRERAVMLTQDEQAELRAEIQDVCKLLTELTKAE